jgi:hypothetical protein
MKGFFFQSRLLLVLRFPKEVARRVLELVWEIALAVPPVLIPDD